MPAGTNTQAHLTKDHDTTLLSSEIFKSSVGKIDGENINPNLVEELLSGTPQKSQPVKTAEAPQLSLEDIKKHSLLGKLTYAPMPSLCEKMKANTEEDAVIRLASNFVGGGLVTGAEGVDGMWGLPNFTAWDWLIDDIIKANTDDGAAATLEEVSTGIKQFLEYSKTQERLEKTSYNRENQLVKESLKIAKRISKLKAGEFQVIYGGWANRGGGSGHAINYEFARAEDGTFDVYIYTSTGFQLTSDVLKGDKRRIKPVVHFKKVPEQDILFNDDRTVRPGFIQALTELNMLSLWDNNFIVDQEDVLEVFDLIAKYRVPVSLEEHGAITGQRAGTCVPSSTKAWIRAHSKNQGLYKQIMFQVKMRLLIATYDKLKDHIEQDTKIGANTRVLLKQVAKKLLRRTAKCVDETSQKGVLINDALAKVAIATAHDVINQVDAAEKMIDAKRKTMTTNGKVYEADVATQRLQRGSVKWEASHFDGDIHASGTPLPKLELTIKPDASNLIDALNASYARQNKLSAKGSHSLANLQLEHILNQLPLPKVQDRAVAASHWVDTLDAPFWDQVQDRQTLENCISILHLMASSYRNSFTEDTATRKFATIFAIQGLIHFLSLKVDKLNGNGSVSGRLGTYSIPFRGEMTNDLEGLTYFSRDEHKKFEEARLYFQAFNRQATGQELFENENSTDIVKSSVNRALGNSAFWNGILSGNQQLYDELKERANVRWPDYSVEYIEEDYQKQVRALRQWEANNVAYQEYRNYREQLNAYNNKWSSFEPTPVPYADYPGEKPSVQRLQNLPLIQKLNMLMEGSRDDEETFQILSRHGYDYLWPLRETTYWCHEWMHSLRVPQTLTQRIWREGRYSTAGGVRKTGSSDQVSSGVRKLGLNDHRSFSDDKYTYFFQYPATHRDVTYWSRGKAEVYSLNKPIHDPILKKLHRNLSEWKLTPYQLVMEMSKNIESLSSPEMQTLFYRLFFRSPVSRKGTPRLGAGELIVDDRALYDNCKAFISKGINHFAKLKGADSDDDSSESKGSAKFEDRINGVRFYLEFSYYLSKYLHDAGHEAQAKNLCSIDVFNRLFKLDKLTEQERGTLHFYRLLFYSNYEIEELTKEQLADIYESWTFYNLYPNDREWKSPVAYELAKKFVNKVTTRIEEALKADDEISSSICTHILKSTGVDNCLQPMNWKCDEDCGYPVFTVKTTATDYYTIDLIKGKVYTPAGELSGVPQNYPWERQEDFKRLFGDEVNFKYRALGGGNIGFKHPDFGSFRLVRDYYSYAIQRQFGDNDSEEWYEYKETSDVEGYPTILHSDHTFWIPVNKGSCHYNGYFASLHTQERKYALNRQGMIIEVDAKTGRHTPHSRYVDSDGNTEALKNFDHHILRFTDTDEVIKRIQFPRYTSIEGNPLAFSEEQNKLVWNDNRQYYIPEEMPKGYLGTIPNYLYLKSTNERKCDKVLVPLQPIILEEVSYANGEINTGNNNTIVPTKRTKGKEMWDKFQYVVFNVEKGNLKPTTQEAQLYLAYVKLSQKDYAQAIELINTVNPMEETSKYSEKILDLIIKQRIIEDHPEAKMVLLHALHKKLKVKDSQATEKIKTYYPREQYNSGDYQDEIMRFWNILVDTKSTYQSHNNIGVACRFTQEDEKDFLEKILTEFQEKRSDIVRFLPKDKQKYIEPTIEQIRSRYDFLQSGKTAPKDGHDTQGNRTVAGNDDGRNRLPLTRMSGGYYSNEPSIDNLINIPRKPIKSNFTYETYADRRRAYEKYRYSSILDKETYEEAYRSYRSKLSQAVEWLGMSQEISRQCTRPNKNISTHKNGALFLEANRVAKQGSQKEREEMIFKLKLWRIHSFKMSRDLPILDLMLVMLKNPDSFPNPISSWSDIEVKGQFLRDCKQAYEQTKGNEHNMFQVDQPTQRYADSVGTENFPVTLTSAFDTKEQTLEDIDSKKQPLSVDLSEDDERWDTLSEWKKHFVVTGESDDDDTSDFSFSFDEKLLSNREKEYVESLKRDLRLLEKDYLQGKSINGKTKNVNLTKENCLELQSEVDAEIISVSEQLSQKMKELLDKANKHPKDIKQQLLNIARKGGSVQGEITFDDCLECFLSLDRREYQLKNPEIGDKKSAEELAQLTLKVLDLKSHVAQLKRVRGLTERITSIDNLSDITRTYLCKKLYGELCSKYHFEEFDQDIQVVLRAFSGETGMIPYEKQTSLIKKMLEVSVNDPDRFKDIVIQLIMGGGKTSVLATILMHIASRRQGRLAMFIVPSSLYDTVKINLGESLNKAFRTKLSAVDMSREQMTKYRLEKLIETFSAAQNKGMPIVVKATTIQALELELLSQARHYKKAYAEKIELEEKYKAKIAELEKVRNRNPKTVVQQAEKKDLLNSLTAQTKTLKTFITHTNTKLSIAKTQLGLLRKVVATLPECGDALIDEVDLILDSLQEVNFPEGDRKPVKIERNNLLLQVFKALVSDIKVNTLEGFPSINDVVGLRNNEQSKMDKNKYLNHVVPVVAEYIFTHFETISDEIPDFKESFVRYASGQIPLFLEDLIARGIDMSEKTLEAEVPNFREYATYTELENDMQFLKFMSQLYNTGDDEQKEAVNLMALTRHFLTELTPATLTKSGRRDYGIKPGSGGRIIPYLAVNTPATTEFGYHWEEACYYYQWAAAFPPSKEQVLEMAKNAESMARYYIQKNGEKYEETVEYLEFNKLFNIHLDEVKEPGKVEEAINFIKQNIDKCLDLQFENVAGNVSYNTERLTSNGVGLYNQLSSRRTMSGTPWNVEGYAKSLKERYEADLGTEGQILNALAKKKKDGKIYEAELTSVEDFMTSIFESHPTPEKIRGIIEAGGQFKAFKNNLEVASHIMAFIENRQDLVDTNIEGVLFFHNDPDQDQPDTLYVWKKGATQPERIGGSSVESLKAKGLEPKKYFTLYDERHTTGTDILQLPDSINLFTFDEKMLRRTVGQGIMRLRQFLYSQDVEVVVTKKSRESIFKGGKTLNDLILHAEKVQSLRKTHDMVRYYQQQIDGIFRNIAITKVIEALSNIDNPEYVSAVIERFEPFFITTMVDEPFLQFGKLKRKVDTKDYLTRYLEKKLNKFSDAMLRQDSLLGMDNKTLAKAKTEAASMKQYIKTAESLPKEWEEPPENIGVEQEVEVQQQVEVNQQIQVNLELETEVELELQRYEAAHVSSYRDESKMTMDELKQKIRNLKTLVPGERSLQDQLRAYKYGFDEKPMPYHRAFSEPIFGTNSFFNTCNNTLPVFHRLQRPAKQILAVQFNKKMHWLLLSEREAKSVKDHLKELYANKDPLAENVWLIQPDGTLLVDSDNVEDFPVEEDYVDEGLLEINAFIGNADYIDKHSGDTEDWLKEHPELKVRFLKLKCARDEKQNKILRCCQVVASRDEKAKFDPNQMTFKARIEKEKHQQGTFRPDSELEAKLLKPKKLKKLNTDFVKYLGIDPDAGDALTIEALAELEKELPAQLGGVDAQQALKIVAEEHTLKQFRALRPYQIAFVEPHQVKYLLPSQIEHLSRKEQFCTFKDEDGKTVPDVYLLTAQQVAGLHKRQRKLIPYINPEHYKSFTHAWQVQGVPPEHIDKLNPNCWIHLSKPQMKGLTSAKIQELKNINLPPEKYGWIHGNLVEGIPPKFFNRVLREQIHEITKPELISQLEVIAKKGEEHGHYTEGLWTSWISPNMVKHIDFKTQIQYLKDQSLILHVPVDMVKYLDVETQVPLIGKDQIPGLANKQIPGCPDDYIRDLIPAQFQWLEDRQYPFLIGEKQIHAIKDKDKFALLKAEDDADAGYENQMQWVHADQLPMVTKEQVKGLSLDQLLSLKGKVKDHEWEELRDGMSVEQIQSMNTRALVRLLSCEQIKNHLHAKQVVFLEDDDQIQSCPDNLVRHLDHIQIQSIKAEQVKHLRNIQVKQIKDEFVKHLTVDDSVPGEVNQMIWLDDEQLEHIDPKQAKGLGNEQILALKGLVGTNWDTYRQELTEDQINGFNTQELFDLLNKDQIHNYAKQDHVKFMKQAWQIKACPDALVQHLDAETQVPYIKASQAQHLMGDRQIKALKQNKTCIQGLLKRQFVHMDDSQFPLLSQGQIALFDKGSDLFAKLETNQIRGIGSLDVIRNLPEDRINVLVHAQFALFEESDRAMIRQLDKHQVKELNKEDVTVIANIAANQVPHLKNEALCKLPNKVMILRKVGSSRLHHLTIKQVKTRDLSSGWRVTGHVFAGLFKTLFTPLMIVVDFVINIAKTIFCSLRALFTLRAENGRKLVGQLKMTFLVGPAINFCAVVEIFHPAKYLQVRSKLTASCE